MPRPRRALVLLLLTLVCFSQSASAQSPPPTVTFFVLPDGNLAPGSESQLTGVVAPPVGPPISYDFDFTEDQRIDRNGYVVLERMPLQPQSFLVVDFLLRAYDRTLGATLTLTPSANPGGTWSTTAANGSFPPGALIAGSLDCNVAVGDPGLATIFPSTATLSVGGTAVPGYYHQVTLLSASLSGVPASNFTLFMKEDLHVPDITWVSTAVAGAASALRAGASTSDAVYGGFGLKRDAATRIDYELVDVALTVDGAPALSVVGGGPGGSGGFITLNPTTHVVTGSLNLIVDGVPVVRTLDGIGDAYTGSPTMPTSLTLTEAALGSLTSFDFVGAKPAILPKVNDFQINQTTLLRVTGRPGDSYLSACSFQPVPGINTPLGDIFVSLDPMFWFSVDPMNGFISGNLGVIGPTGESTISVLIPNAPWLIGVTTFFAGALLTYDASAGGLLVSGATNPHRAIIR